MARVRRDVWKLDEGWNETLLWYARGVEALRKRPITDRTSWLFLGGMHGFHQGLWEHFNYIAPGATLPDQAERETFWDQCQHQTWYFLPWHRAYLAAVEAILRGAIMKANGPADWALPYWNYPDAQSQSASAMPPVFAERDWPDGPNNPLFVEQRFGPFGDGNVFIPVQDASLDAALREGDFDGDSSGGSPGFGGPETLFSHNSQDSNPPTTSGLLEDLPHNVVHGDIGGTGPDGWPGVMSIPQSAALDPIFWLHHANIDRVWEIWRGRTPSEGNPTSTNWLDGPSNRAFIMPRPDGESWTVTAREMEDTQAPDLDYVYEDVDDPLGGETRVAARAETLRRAAPVIASADEWEPVMAKKQPAELMGANDAPISIRGATVATDVPLDAGVARKTMDSLSASRAQTSRAGRAAPSEPDRVFLNLEGIRGENDGAVFEVYVGLATDADPAAHPENRVASLGMFGVSQASRADGPHGGNGLTKVVEITGVVDALKAGGVDDLGKLDVRFVPRRADQPGGDISIDRVSVYRQGAAP